MDHTYENCRDGARQLSNTAFASPHQQQRSETTPKRHDLQFARVTNARTAHNLVAQAHKHLCLGCPEEARELTRLALQFFDRAEHDCDVILLPVRGSS